jgi:RNA polymerase sigma-70 factor (ECF subfamily)
MELSDSELAALAGRGDTDAYRRLFERYQHPVYNFVYRLVDNAADASDIVQDAFIKMHAALGERDIQNFSAYLYRTAKNLAYDEMRRRSRFVDVDQEILAPEDPNIYADPQRALLLGEQLEAVRRAARRLNENQRAALILRELEELDYDQMSDVLESNRNAVGALLSRARLKFREELRMAQISTELYPPECEEVIALLSPYIDGELGDDEKERVEGHLEDCTFCLAALEEMRDASRSFRMFIPVIPPAGIAQAVTGRLAELAAGGAGDAGEGGSGPDATRVHKGEQNGGSRIARLARSKVFWISMAVVALLLFVPVAWLVAENRGDTGSESLPAIAASFQAGTTATRTRTESQGLNGDRTEDTNPADTTPAGTAATDTTANGGRTLPVEPVSKIGVVSGSASPNPVYQRKTVTYKAEISGQADSVTLQLVSQYDGSTSEIALSRQSSSGDRETWGAGGVAASAPGGYYIYVTATTDAGQVAEGYVGMLTIYPNAY